MAYSEAGVFQKILAVGLLLVAADFVTTCLETAFFYRAAFCTLLLGGGLVDGGSGDDFLGSHVDF